MAISGISGTSYIPSSLTSNSQAVWTATKLSQLKNYAQLKMSVDQIAQKLGCTASDVQMQAAKLGLKLTTS
jgi:hypothetical protein